LGLTPSFLFIDLILSILTKQKSKKQKKQKQNKKQKNKNKKQKKSDRKKLQIFHFLCSRVAEGQG